MVEGLIRNPEIAALYGQNAQTWAKGELSVENVAAKYAQVLDASVGSPNYSNGVAASSEGENILPRKSIIIDGSVTNWWMRVAEQVEAIRGDGKFFLTFRTSRELVEEMEDCVLAERLDGVGISMLSANTAILDGMPDNVCIEICVG